MTNYNDIAKRIMAQGFGECVPIGHAHGGRSHTIDDGLHWLTPEQFCNDGRVVLALMEKVWNLHKREGMKTLGILRWIDLMRTIRDISKGVDSLAIAIVLACLDVLEKDNES